MRAPHFVYGRVNAWIAGLLTQDFRKQEAQGHLASFFVKLCDFISLPWPMALALVLHPATPQGCSGTRAEAGGIGLRTKTMVSMVFLLCSDQLEDGL